MTNSCPTCGRAAAAQCRCPLGDRVCPAGHHWHRCPGCGAAVPGEADHAKDTAHPDHRCAACRSKAHV